MAMPPNINNYTVPGGVRLFFDDGTGERDLGNLVSLDLVPGTKVLEHYTNRSGKRTKDDVLTLEESLSLKFKMDEPVMENWRYYLKGATPEVMGGGTLSKVGQTLVLNGNIFTSVGQFFGLTAISARQFVDYCLRYDGVGLAFIDNSVEADAVGGVPFDAVDDPSDFLYIGKSTKFANLYFNLAADGTYVNPKWEYWNGAAWTTFTPSGAGDALAANGNVALGNLANWAQHSVNGLTAYWVRFSAGTVTIKATVNAIRQALIVDTDYVVDPGATAPNKIPGRFSRVTGGLLADGEAVKVSFTYVTFSSTRFAIAGSDFIKGAARLEVHPSAGRGLKFDIEIPLCQMKPDGNVTLDDQKFMEVGIELEVLDNTPVTPDYPFGRFVIYDQ